MNPRAIRHVALLGLGSKAYFSRMSVKIQCPHCVRTLAVPDEVAGRRVKCPNCQQIFPVPTSTDIATTPVAKHVPAAPPADRPLPAKRPASAAIQNSVTPPRPTRTSCPECGETLAPDASKCPDCGWVSKRRTGRVSRHAAGTDGGCYILIRRDEVDLALAIEKRMTKLIESEQLGIEIMDEDEQPPDDLGAKDLLISGKVNRCDYGSRAMRYWLTIVALFGPGSSRLEVEAEAETAEGGHRRVSSRSRLWIGFLGGSSTGLMKRNVQVVSTRIANGAARHATGRSFLNAQAYTCANWSLGLGLISLIPFIGIPFGLIGLVLGIVAFTTISRRKLPRKKGVALSGIALPILGVLVTAGLIFLMSNK